MVGVPLSVTSDYLLPVLVLLTFASVTSTLGLSWKVWNLVRLHDRALFGEDEVNGHDGLVVEVKSNTERVEEHREALREEDLL